MLLVETRIGPSSIHGIGLFAAEPIPKGVVTWRFRSSFDCVLTLAEYINFPTRTRRFIDEYGCWSEHDKMWMLCGDNARFMNHSDEPSTRSLGIGFADDVAARDILSGEELTCDYRTICDLRCNMKLES